MSLYFIWDSAYESLPGQSLPRSLIANEIRTMKLGIRSMMEFEHNFGFNPPLDNGAHWGGHVTVAVAATNTTALTQVMEGALFINNSSYPALAAAIYHAGAWIPTNALDHSAFSDRSDAVANHNQYIAKTNGEQNEFLEGSTSPFNMGGHHIWASAGTNTYGQLLLFGHRHTTHSGWGSTIGSGAEMRHKIFNKLFGSTLFSIAQSSVSGTINNGSNVDIDIGAYGYYLFVPKIIATGQLYIQASTSFFALSLRNDSGAALSYRVEWEYIQVI